MILGESLGLVWIIGTICFCFAAVGIGIIVSEIFGRQHAVLWIVGLQCAFQILISFTSAEFVALSIGGVAFITIAGSLIYPTIELGANYLNEFYGLEVSRTSVNAQLVCRVITSAVLAFLFLLPTPAGFEQNHHDFVHLNQIVPRIAAASIVATWVTGMVMVYVYDLVRIWTNGRMLWLRAVSSNVVSMAANSVLFVLLAFAGVMSTDVLMKMVLVQILFKFIDSFFELGFLYALRALKARGFLRNAAQPALAGTS
ncbi:MAG TPA: queuosine precursor transporter [Xanthobacteraceae bacterium]|nr:queuosine precursor transporter [Xanthobacteraceae bacterium]